MMEMVSWPSFLLSIWKSSALYQRSCSVDLECYLAALEDIIKYFFT